ncbi:MAG: hypothetical protein ABGX27_05505, partial [Desulfurobacteriaceae bacterium]
MKERKGYILIGVLGVVVLLSLGASILTKFTQTETNVTADSLYSRKAYEIARSGIELGLLKYKNEKTCGWKIEKDFNGGKFVVESSGDSKGCKIVSYGYYRDAVRKIEVGSEIKELSAFVVGGNLRLFDSLSFSPQIEDADFSIGGSVYVDGLLDEDAIDELKDQGFKVSKSIGEYPTFPTIVYPTYNRTAPSYTVKPLPEVPPPTTCDITIEENKYYISNIKSDGTLILLNRYDGSYEYKSLKGVKTICGDGSDELIILDGTISSAWLKNGNLELTIYSPSELTVQNLKVDYGYYPKSDLKLISDKKVSINTFSIPSISIGDDFNFTVYAPSVAAMDITIQAVNPQGDFNINLFGRDSIGISEFSIENVNTQHKLNFYANSNDVEIGTLNFEGAAPQEEFNIDLEGNKV